MLADGIESYVDNALELLERGHEDAEYVRMLLATAQVEYDHLVVFAKQSDTFDYLGIERVQDAIDAAMAKVLEAESV